MTDDGHTVVETATCVCCGEKFEAEFMVIEGRPFPRRKQCSACAAKENERLQNEERERAIRKRTAALAQIILPLYTNTDRQRLHPKLLELIDGFEVNGSLDIFLSAPAGTGKTRAMTVLLVRAYDADRSILMVNATVLSAHCVGQFSNDAERRKNSQACLAQCLEVDVLLIDDLGKERATERVETELYRILEHRTSSLLPTLFTSNLGIGDLLQKFSPDQGPAIVRRIAEFSKIVRL